MQNKKWIKYWTDGEKHKNSKKIIFDMLDSYTGKIDCMLDIGCGLARESEYYQKKYGTDLYLLDGDFEGTENNNRDTNYGSVKNFKFYSKIEDLKKSWHERNLDYFFVDALDIKIPDNIKFDLIYSAVSCGFHYPASTYKDIILKHSTENTKIIFDIRNNSNQEDITIKNILHSSKKYITAEIEFK